MKNILITGANGQVGQEFQAIATLYPKFHFLFANKQSLNITNADAVNTYFEANAIDAVVNCAAYTKVDKAESEVALANLVNGIGALNLAKACAAHNAWMIQISTDFVFNGQSKKPYQTNHPTQPIGVYGSSKLLGEQAILEHCPKGVVLRTSWVYSTFGHNFVKTMLRLGTSRSELGVIADQTGCPTYARDLAKAIMVMLQAENRLQGKSIYHYSNQGVTTWHGFATKIMELANLDCQVNAIGTADYPTPAKRPAYSLLAIDKIMDDFDLKIPYWQESLRIMMNGQ